MATLARLWTIPDKLSAQKFVALGLVAIFAALGGIYWDVTWRATVGRDSFWIPPHLLVYSGVNLVLLASLGGLVLARRREISLRFSFAYGAGTGFALAALDPVIQIAAAPLDDLWHRLYGLDVTIWSPPHLMASWAAWSGYTACSPP